VTAIEELAAMVVAARKRNGKQRNQESKTHIRDSNGFTVPHSRPREGDRPDMGNTEGAGCDLPPAANDTQERARATNAVLR